jgi:FKBP-type peptidyl-prolyl cis-trans isomerase SlyD
MKIADKKVVSMHYTLKDENGVLLDTSDGREPLVYLHGSGNIIPGLESQLIEKSTGDKLSVVVAPEDAYGVKRDDLQQVVPKENFRGDEELVQGMTVQVETNEGVAIAVVSVIEGENVTLDLNHPLADKTLHFDVEVVDVREASEEELEKGHVHVKEGVEQS